MQEITPERVQVEDEAKIWAAAPSSDNKRELGPFLILRMIAVVRDDVRQELAKDQIAKALKALRRGDQEGASQHIKLVFAGVAHKPVGIDWNDLVEQAERLKAAHPADMEE